MISPSILRQLWSRSPCFWIILGLLVNRMNPFVRLLFIFRSSVQFPICVINPSFFLFHKKPLILNPSLSCAPYPVQTLVIFDECCSIFLSEFGMHYFGRFGSIGSQVYVVWRLMVEAKLLRKFKNSALAGTALIVMSILINSAHLTGKSVMTNKSELY